MARRFGLAVTAAIFGMAIAATAGAQTIFTYSATDYKTIVLTGPGSTAVAVNTVIIVQAGAVPQQSQGPTKTFDLRFRAPQATAPRLLQALVDGHIVNVRILRSDIDGNLEATVEIPVSAGDSSEVKLIWDTKSAGPMEMTVKPTQHLP